ncbi:MAG TPA: metalloregulator ArsR/SmtB family transcription factor [Usitatibacter sp.]|nr:metalloregulator ArsR/SmtB family transcription factor [Usitatibacter sp.]
MDSATAVTSLAALAQESRLAIFRLLVEAGPTGLSVGEIGAALRVAPATLSFHLKALAHAGLIQARQDGRFIYYSASYARMNALVDYLGENCCARDCGPGCGPRARNARPSRAPKKHSKETS